MILRKKNKCSSKNQGISLVLTLLIISSILTGTLLVAETTIRHSRVVKGIEVSEKAYFATKTAVEKVSYQVNQNYADISSYTLSGSFDDGSEYEGTVSADTDCPNPPTECASGAISPTNAWIISLEPGESLELDLNINGATYPTSLQISQTSSEPTDLIIYQCDTGGSPRVCVSSIVQTLISSFPYSLNTSGYAGKYYQIRIINNGVASETYTLTPTGANLPIGIKIQGTGSYVEYERQLESNIPKWQKFGF